MTYRRLACVLFCLSACNSSTTASVDAPAAGSDAPPGIDAAIDAGADACATIAATRCTKLQGCSAADLEKRFGDLATCETRLALTCTEARAAAGTGNTDTSILACNDAIAAESCRDLFTKAPPTACTTQIGTETTTCEFSAQCTTGFCGLPGSSVCGTCAPQPKAGDSCATIGCGQDLSCVPSTQLCQAPVAAGGACSRDLPCAEGFTCVGAVQATQTNGVCTAEVATLNGACDPKHKTGADCSGDAGLTCDTTTNTCVAQPIAAAGSACGLASGIRTACSGGATCVIPTGMTAGTCVAPAADGAACDTATGPGCLTPARCIVVGAGSGSGSGNTAGTCELPGSATCP